MIKNKGIELTKNSIAELEDSITQLEALIDNDEIALKSLNKLTFWTVLVVSAGCIVYLCFSWWSL